MSQARTTELLSILVAPVVTELDEGSAFPFAVSTDSVGLDVINTDNTNPLVITLTFLDDSTLDITVPASGKISQFYNKFKSVNTGGTSTAYIIHVKQQRIKEVEA